MNKNVFIAGILGGLVFFIWQTISYTMLPWHTPKNIPGADPIVEMLREREMEHGVYHYPGFPDRDALKSASEDEKKAMWGEVKERYERGPQITQLIYKPGGGSMMMPLQMVTGLIIAILAAMIAAFVMNMGIDKMPNFSQRVVFSTELGFFAALLGPVMDINWWYYPTDFSVPVALDNIIGFFLVGLVLAWRLKPESKSEETVQEAPVS